jgi:diaminopimelate epimerase
MAYSLEDIITITPQMCNRKMGIGADGILLLNPPSKSNTDFEMVYRNADGSDAGMCGNGGRCIAKFANLLGMGNSFNFSVHKGLYHAQVNTNNVQLKWIGLKVTVSSKTTDYEPSSIYQLNTGTDHVVLLDQDLSNAEDLIKRGAELRCDKVLNPAGTNVNFIAEVKDPNSELKKLNVVTYERGVENLTLACGTGALASAITWHSLGRADTDQQSLIIAMPGGELECSFEFNKKDQTYHALSLSGPAISVFNGVFNA